ncbi:YigZ family protein [Alteromonas sp. KUL49]|uniref:YigZ family protein n=1 Tax=Alteromonas sp. KUL49 TaxID=2480798 RepID=UPI00102F1C46|nr:YigZ family protein [Alteromonas sp. KUL49]TAP38832.1 YigZ family protein [Alteromonas sp. KUL49]GEA12263.1 YigZ family protein [Alteromonas sp. KUL49]
MHYPVPASQARSLLEVKKSKFIAYAAFADSRSMAMSFLAELRGKYPDARHHCWAYQLGNPDMPDSAAMGDDGEPSGTAGKPILNVLQHKGVGNIMIVVVRYFGGIKLGAGGLVRAYSGAAQQVMTKLEVKQQAPQCSALLRADFKHEQFLRHLVSECEGSVDSCDYALDVAMKVTVPQDNLSKLSESIAGLPISILAD